jgi:hypothetical protein
MAKYLVIANDRHGNKLEQVEIDALNKHDAEIKWRCFSTLHTQEIAQVYDLLVYKLDHIFLLNREREGV